MMPTCPMSPCPQGVCVSLSPRCPSMCPLCPKTSVCPTQFCPQAAHVPHVLLSPSFPCVPRVPVPKLSTYGSHVVLSPRCWSVPVPRTSIRVSHVSLSPRHPCFPHSFVPNVSTCPPCPCPQDVRLWVPHGFVPKMSVCPCPHNVCVSHVSLSPRCPSTCPTCPCPHDAHVSHVTLSPRCLCVPVPKVSIHVSLVSQDIRVSHTALSPRCPRAPHAPVPKFSMCPLCSCPQAVHLWLPCGFVPTWFECPCPQDVHPCVPCATVPKLSIHVPYVSHVILSPRCPCVPCPCPQDIRVSHTALSPSCLCAPRAPVPKFSMCPPCPCPQAVHPRVPHVPVPMMPTCPMSPCPQGVCVSLSPRCPSMCPLCPCPQDIRVSHTALSPRCSSVPVPSPSPSPTRFVPTLPITPRHPVLAMPIRCAHTPQTQSPRCLPAHPNPCEPGATKPGATKASATKPSATKRSTHV
ncbi:vegetative cell wall protein gp1-like [Phasianus colchicus]|uniref:vegetative cell wall protein gp1-like n=1 Tax=Phasianus colchicus TaxID=9054 RepID=UPI00129DED45|nr:vegetative cell wall protein gp1-like [Phasianus colchicus]